jgi:hypothetical protein
MLLPLEEQSQKAERWIEKEDRVLTPLQHEPFHQHNKLRTLIHHSQHQLNRKRERT